MKRIVETEEETQRAVENFRRRIRAISGKSRVLEWGFPNGVRANYPTFTLTSDFGQLQVGVPGAWANRLPHLFRFVKPAGPPSPDVEVNIPNSLNRSIAGVYVVTDDSTWLCSRGDFTAFRGKIPRAVIFQHFDKWLITVDDGDREAEVVPIAALDSRSLANDLAQFIQAILELKAQHKGDDGARIAIAPPAWRTGKEFEGLKHPGRGRTPEAYEYLHGPLCNGLARCLREAIAGRSKIQIRRNSNVDAAVIERQTERARIIFEVKTSAHLASQVYSAVGQLLFYQHAYGSKDCVLALVLPREHRTDAKKLDAFLGRLGIHTIIGDGARFETVSGKTLKQFVLTYAGA